ncbi:hypothetical protein H0H93_013359, partial [Arthromyces matolae]
AHVAEKVSNRSVHGEDDQDHQHKALERFASGAYTQPPFTGDSKGENLSKAANPTTSTSFSFGKAAVAFKERSNAGFDEGVQSQAFDPASAVDVQYRKAIVDVSGQPISTVEWRLLVVLPTGQGKVSMMRPHLSAPDIGILDVQRACKLNHRQAPQYKKLVYITLAKGSSAINIEPEEPIVSEEEDAVTGSNEPCYKSPLLEYVGPPLFTMEEPFVKITGRNNLLVESSPIRTEHNKRDPGNDITDVNDEYGINNGMHPPQDELANDPEIPNLEDMNREREWEEGVYINDNEEIAMAKEVLNLDCTHSAGLAQLLHAHISKDYSVLLSMPEQAEKNSFKARLDAIIDKAVALTGLPPEAVLQIFPRVFAEGTRGKPYCTMSNNKLPGYDPNLETPLEDGFKPNTWDKKRSKKKPWNYLITQPLTSGPLCVAGRGKGLVIAAGHGKANRLRSFPLPPRFTDTNSSKKKKRTVNIFAAFLTATDAVVLIDFSRLIRLHVTSSPHIWQQSDFAPGSKHWSRIWAPFPNGPDLILERDLALDSLDKWRQRVISGYQANVPIVEAMASNNCLAFGGFGRHLANDFLFLAGIFPNMPCSFLCNNDYLFEHLKAEIPGYLETFETRDYKRLCLSITNSNNPFSFNVTADTNYTSQHILVFRRSSVRMPANLYNAYLEQGLLDPNHTLYEPYNKPVERYNGEYQVVPVYFYDLPEESFTAIAAKPPAAWRCSEKVFRTKDITLGGYATLIRPAQFREFKVNMLNTKRLVEAIRRGRPAKILTGRRGRPSKTVTKSSIARMENLVGRRQVVTAPIGEDGTMRRNSRKENVIPSSVDNQGPGKLYKTRSRYPLAPL